MITDVANFYGNTKIAFEKDYAEDILAKLELVKSNLAMIIELSNWYAVETGNSFSQMLKIGIMSVIESAGGLNDFHHTFMKNANKPLFEGVS